MNYKRTTTPQDNSIRPGVLFAVIGASALVCLLAGLNLSAKSNRVVSSTAASTSTQPLAQRTTQDRVAIYQDDPIPQTAVSSKPTTAEAELPAAVRMPSSALEKSGGLEAFSITLVRNDLALDVRYRITKSDKVAALAEQAIPAYLVDKASGQWLPVAPPAQNAKMHPQQRARSAMMMNQATGFPPSAERVRADGRSYSVLIPNLEGIVKRGAKVMLKVGSLESAPLVVQ